jgi:hypothetical protein
VAGWVGGGIAAVFFASLERCSCVNVRTQDDLRDDEQRDSEAPLVVHDGNGVGGSTAGSAASMVRRGGGTRNNDRGVSCYGDF